MLPSHIQRHIESCHEADLSNPGIRANVERVLIPKLSRVRRSMVLDLLVARRSKHTREISNAKTALLEVKLAIRTARDRLEELS